MDFTFDQLETDARQDAVLFVRLNFIHDHFPITVRKREEIFAVLYSFVGDVIIVNVHPVYGGLVDVAVTKQLPFLDLQM